MAAIITDNFDSYSTGDLNGQGSWSGNTAFDVQTTVVQSSPNGVENASAGSDTIDKTGTALTEGTQRVYVRANSALGTLEGRVLLMESTNARVITRWFGNTTDLTFQYFNGDIANWSSLGTAALDTWHIIDIEWRASDKKARYRLNEGSWSSYVATFSTYTTNLDGVRLQQEGSTGTNYWDSLQEVPVAPAGSTRDGRLLNLLGVG